MLISVYKDAVDDSLPDYIIWIEITAYFLRVRRLFFCLGIMLSMHVTKTIKSHTQ